MMGQPALNKTYVEKLNDQLRERLTKLRGHCHTALDTSSAKVKKLWEANASGEVAPATSDGGRLLREAEDKHSAAMSELATIRLQMSILQAEPGTGKAELEKVRSEGIAAHDATRKSVESPGSRTIRSRSSKTWRSC